MLKKNILLLALLFQATPTIWGTPPPCWRFWNKRKKRKQYKKHQRFEQLKKQTRNEYSKEDHFEKKLLSRNQKKLNKQKKAIKFAKKIVGNGLKHRMNMY